MACKSQNTKGEYLGDNMERIKEVVGIVGELLWRGFGILLYIIGASAGTGAILTGDPFTGILIAWGTLMLGIVGAIGYAIATTGQATKATVAKGAKDAIQKAEKKNEQ
jgi:hypothetical protein